jgi:hypothetical protein
VLLLLCDFLGTDLLVIHGKKGILFGAHCEAVCLEGGVNVWRDAKANREGQVYGLAVVALKVPGGSNNFLVEVGSLR